jgi:putative flippase GtrA
MVSGRILENGVMVSLLKRSASGTSNPAYLVRYVSIGAVSVFVDLAAFQALLKLHVFLPLTTTAAFVLAAVVHFSLNKLWTFRVRGAPHAYQVTAYVTVLFTSLVITQCVIEISVLVFHILPVVAKLMAILVQLPVSFFGHRYFTFREGRELNP